MRNLRSRKKRAQLFLDFNGKCANCGCDLVKWHADHKIPFFLTKRTDYVNMQPLCPPCNLKKGKKVLSPKNRNYYESLNLGVHVDIIPFRIGQKGAFNCIVEKVLDHEQTISIVLPTRYGKSDVIRASAIELQERGAASGCLISAPCKFLRDQLMNKKKVSEMVNRYTIDSKQPITFDVLENFRLPIFQNNEHFVGLTTQMLATNTDQICEYIKLHVRKTGKPFLIYIDESGLLSDVNIWGTSVLKLKAAGAIVILLTATPYRDGEAIPGFKTIIENKREKIRHVPRQHDDADKYWLDIYRDIEGDLRLEADYEYTFKSAWAEGDVICKIDRKKFDVVVKIPTGEADNMKEVRISEMPTSECRKYFGRVVKDIKVIRTGVEELVERLRDYRLYEPSAQAIVFCGNDVEGDDDDGHAKQIAAEISCLDTKFKVIIATSKQDSADDLIKKFGEGNGDILIVKQMASLGMDIPSIKIGLDLSAVRTLAAFIQRMMRTATMWGNNQVAHLIIPSDVNGEALWEGFIKENNGCMTTHETKKVDSIEKEKKEKDDTKKTFEVVRTENLILSDNSGLGSSDSNDYNEFARPLIMYHPKIQAVFTDHETVMFGKQIGKDALSRLAPKALVGTRDITEQRILLKNRIELLRKDIASQRFNYGSNKDEWIAENKECLNRAKRAIGIHLRTSLEKITNVDYLTKIKEHLEAELNTAKFDSKQVSI